ncbi:hypothetical protein [Shewanella sp. ENK2]|uniref:pPIWI-associating nuclease domain-containing protein n=1 Tax=Shewanella sp. ENK2 TaxID=2775245 RepID=UPI00374A3E7A
MKLKKLLQHDFIIEFESLLACDFEKTLFKASLRNYCSHGNPLRFHNFAFSMRELVLRIIDRRAPNSEVKNANWYKRESTRYEVTRRQKLKFCAQRYLSDKYLNQDELDELNQSIKDYLKEFNFFNKYTHITPKHLNSCPHKFYDDMKFIIKRSKEVIEQLSTLEGQVASCVESKLQDEIFDKVVNNFPDDLSILANNVILEQVYPEVIVIDEITENRMDLIVTGSLEVSQEYGKGEDFLEMSNSYSFETSVDVSVSDPLDINVYPNDVEIDTSSWYE